MDHETRTREEFTRQAATFDVAPVVTDAELTARFVDAARADSTTAALDLACGPGIVTAALARVSGTVVAFDLTPEMLTRAESRCRAAGTDNVSFRQGDAAALPFADGTFDRVVTRLSIHHFPDPARVLAEIHRVARPGARLVLGDIVSSENTEEAALHNAIETLRDPSHLRMLPASELTALVTQAGFTVATQTSWDQPRRFDEWAAIVADPVRVAPLRTVVASLARAGASAGIALAADGDVLSFVHRWLLIAAERTG
jgi:ubiquinone/menaquinone biosynthesis C-methylase UbiE